MIRTQVPLANMEQIFAGDYYNPYPNLDDEVAILKSYTLNYRVIEDMPELHVAYVPVSRNGIQGQRTYKTSPFVVKKLSDEQPARCSNDTSGSQDPIHIQWKLMKTRSKHGARSTGQSQERGIRNPEHELKLGEVYNHNGFNFVVETTRQHQILLWREQPLARLV